MKTRQGFVSNSSSSSFIVMNEYGVDNLTTLKNHYLGDVYIVGHAGNIQFGWQVEEYNDVDSKINWASMQAIYLKLNQIFDNNDMTIDDKINFILEDNQYLNMIEHVVENNLGCGISFVDLIKQMDDYTAYIDHQSTSCQDDSQLNMFRDETYLDCFLFNKNNYIKNDNDNH